MGHLARLVEAAGISTVIVAVSAFKPRMEKMMLPRLLLTEHMMGRPFGAPHNAARQRVVLDAALALLQRAESIRTIEHLSGSYEPVS